MKKTKYLHLFGLIASLVLVSACSQQPAAIPEAGGSAGSAAHPASNTQGVAMHTGSGVTSTGADSGGARGTNNVNTHTRDAMAITPENLDNPQSPLYQRIIYFDYNQATVKPQYQVVLDAHSKLLARHPHMKVRLEGHADERGTREYNVALSEERAKAVQWSMRSQGVKTSQTEIIAYGEERPAVVGGGERSWAKNRRVEIKYIQR